MFTADMSRPAVDCINVTYTSIYDITQVISHAGRSRQYLASGVTYEIQKIKNYEKLWKIKTKHTKFKIIPIAVKMKEDIAFEREIIPYTNHGKILGQNISLRNYKSR